MIFVFFMFSKIGKAIIKNHYAFYVSPCLFQAISLLAYVFTNFYTEIAFSILKNIEIVTNLQFNGRNRLTLV